MRGLTEKIEKIMMAVTFAEAGEHKTAREIMKEEKRPEKRVHISRLEKLWMAVAFAEAGEHETAREIMKEEKRPEKRDRITPYKRTQERKVLRAE